MVFAVLWFDPVVFILTPFVYIFDDTRLLITYNTKSTVIYSGRHRQKCGYLFYLFVKVVLNNLLFKVIPLQICL